MKSYRCLLAAALTFVNSGIAQADDFEPNRSSAMNVKFGYFSLNRIRAVAPESTNFEQLRYQAEDQFRFDVAQANQRLEEFRKTNPSESAVDAKQKELQNEVNEKQKALTTNIEAMNALLNNKIRKVAETVSKAHGLDTIVDASGVYYGGKEILDKGIDVTAEILKYFRPDQTAE